MIALKLSTAAPKKPSRKRDESSEAAPGCDFRIAPLSGTTQLRGHTIGFS